MNTPPTHELTLDNPYLESLGVELVDWRPGHVKFALRTGPAHANRTGVVQGGMLATVLDAACGYAGLYPEAGGARHASTVSLAIQFVAPARLGRLEIAGWVSGGGRKIYFSGAEVRDAEGAIVAQAQGSFRRLN